MILVDGRARISCLKRAQSRVKPGGYIMLDDAERKYYNPGKALFDGDDWEEIVLPGKVKGTKTIFYRRRSE